MKYLYSFIIILFLPISVNSQCDGRYLNQIFSSVSVSEVYYSDQYIDNEHKMDIYIPDGDTVTNRPVIFFIHGGSFYAGDKSDVACVNFCTDFAKKGYVAISANYRLVSLLNIVNFLTNQDEQYEEVLKAVADIKAAIRFVRKDFENGNNYGIDPNTIFVGGNSAGAITAIHLAYIDDIGDLPTSPINVQNIANSLGGIDGDAGNSGYSSEVSGVISFAGGINNTSWIDANDEPLVSCQGDADQTVSYNCGPGLGQSTVLELCGTAEMHPQADIAGILNDKLVFSGQDHAWCSAGNSNAYFVQAIDFTKNFLYPLLPCNNITNINEFLNTRTLLKVTDLMGRKVIKPGYNSTLFYIYDDGSVEKKIIIQ